jgi:hypothetical protein
MSYLYWRSYSWSFNFPGGREWWSYIYFLDRKLRKAELF